jgi:hypothetical protein
MAKLPYTARDETEAPTLGPFLHPGAEVVGHKQGSPAGVSIDETTEGRFGSTPDLARSKSSGLTGEFIVKVDSMAKSKRPEIALVMFRPAESSKNHHGASSAHGIFDCIFGDAIVVMTTNATVFNPLPFGGQFGGELLRSIDAVVGTIGTNVNTSGGRLALELELGLNGFCSSKAYLVDHREFATRGVTKDSATSELLSSEIVPTSGELAPEKRRFILVREDQVPRL